VQPRRGADSSLSHLQLSQPLLELRILGHRTANGFCISAGLLYESFCIGSNSCVLLGFGLESAQLLLEGGIPLCKLIVGGDLRRISRTHFGSARLGCLQFLLESHGALFSGVGTGTDNRKLQLKF
jgi:hypothetical protein